MAKKDVIWVLFEVIQCSKRRRDEAFAIVSGDLIDLCIAIGGLSHKKSRKSAFIKVSIVYYVKITTYPTTAVFLPVLRAFPVAMSKRVIWAVS